VSPLATLERRHGKKLRRKNRLFTYPSLAARALTCVALLATAAYARDGITPTLTTLTATYARVTKGPLSKRYVLGALRRGQPKKRELIRLVRQRGVSFELTDKDESQLRAAGATPALLEALRDNYRESQADIPPVLPPTPHPVTKNRHDDTFSPPDSTSGGPGMGTGTGGGIGPGEGTGYGPGRGEGNPTIPKSEADNGSVDYTRPFKPGEVTVRAIITSKPDPVVTEEARKNNVSGIVRLRAILAADGSVKGISVIKGLPDGLTETAIAAAKQIRFKPAQKDGHTVSQYVVLEYNFYVY